MADDAELERLLDEEVKAEQRDQVLSVLDEIVDAHEAEQYAEVRADVADTVAYLCERFNTHNDPSLGAWLESVAVHAELWRRKRGRQ